MEDESSNGVFRLNKITRAFLTERMAKTADQGFERLLISSEIHSVRERAALLSPLLQADRLLIELGNKILQTGEGIEHISPQTAALVRSVDLVQIGSLLQELLYSRLIKGVEVEATSTSEYTIQDVDLTLEGWRKFERLRKGNSAGTYGFIAMKFNDERLESFVRDFLKPLLKTELAIELLDVRDVSKAGVIDNIMREAIRDSAFVLSDLSHDNNGAYWEGGFAEGVGKPVIYICEREKFKSISTHFDTNHSTTVIWHEEDTERFGRELIATIKRSID